MNTPVTLVRLAASPALLRPVWAGLLLFVAALLPACSDNNAPPPPGQALVSVNGAEITAMQLNEELQRANVHAAQQEVASKKLLEALIDRQLLQNEAAKDQTDRDPKVIQAIERAKALIIAQAYMQKKIGNIARPSSDEVGAYYASHPDFFSNRKQFDMQQLIIDSSVLTDELKQAADRAGSLDELAQWLDSRKIKFLRTQASRTTSDLSPAMSAKLKGMDKGQLFIVTEGPRSMLVALSDIKDNPASLALAAPQIEKYLLNKRTKEAADAELARLRAGAEIAYLNRPAPEPAAPPAAPRPATDDTTARGVAGLK